MIDEAINCCAGKEEGNKNILGTRLPEKKKHQQWYSAATKEGKENVFF